MGMCRFFSYHFVHGLNPTVIIIEQLTRFYRKAIASVRTLPSQFERTLMAGEIYSCLEVIVLIQYLHKY